MDTPTRPSRSGPTERLAAFLAATASGNETGDVVADAATTSLAGLASSSLPPAAQPLWREIARLFKASPDTPLPIRAIEALRSWPVTRLATLRAKVRDVHDILQRIDNDRWEDDIRDKLRHHYL